jgi:hypothetical protein
MPDEPPASSADAPDAIPVRVVGVTIAKEGHAAEENEDAFAVSSSGFPCRAAIADGATESVYAGLWAEALAEAVAGADLASPEDWDDALGAARTSWAASVDASTEPVPWYVEEKRRQGAFATVLGVSLHAGGRLQARAVGDGVLIRRRDGTQTGWPIDDPDAFSNRPKLVSSRARAAAPDASVHTGTWAPGDTFLLATDAVAAWLLANAPDLPDTADDLESTLRQARTDGRLRNDDLTLIRIDMR